MHISGRCFFSSLLDSFRPTNVSECANTLSFSRVYCQESFLLHISIMIQDIMSREVDQSFRNRAFRNGQHQSFAHSNTRQHLRRYPDGYSIQHTLQAETCCDSHHNQDVLR